MLPLETVRAVMITLLKLWKLLKQCSLPEPKWIHKLILQDVTGDLSEKSDGG